MKHPLVQPCWLWRPVNSSVRVSRQLAPEHPPEPALQPRSPKFPLENYCTAPFRVSPYQRPCDARIVANECRQPGLLHRVGHPVCHGLHCCSPPKRHFCCLGIDSRHFCRGPPDRITAPRMVSGSVSTTSVESYRYGSRTVRYQARLSVSVRIQDRTLNAICNIIRHIEHPRHSHWFQIGRAHV